MPSLLIIPRTSPGPASTPGERAASLAALLTERAISDKQSGLSEIRIVAMPPGGSPGRAGVDAVAVGVEDPLLAVGLLLTLVRSDAWDVVLVVGRGGAERVGDREVVRAVARASRATGRCALAHPRSRASSEGADGSASRAAAEHALQLLGVLERRRTVPQHEAGLLVEAGRSQREAAAHLGVSQQAVNDRLRHGLWHETRSLAGSVAALVRDLEAG